ncbi:hypothetical protein HanIR_Chr14g0703581 [Helianthus annuus]|nr:hypothetical protein HanIR_Chr14g0703581 [Helianthus annuus]
MNQATIQQVSYAEDLVYLDISEIKILQIKTQNQTSSTKPPSNLHVLTCDMPTQDMDMNPNMDSLVTQ